MRKLKPVLLSLAVCSMCASRSFAGEEATESEELNGNHSMVEAENKPLPAAIQAFQKLNFDERMERQEYLCLKYHSHLFIDAVRHHILESDETQWDNRWIRAMETAYLGREAGSLPQGISMPEAMKLCGLKRLAALHQFKTQDKSVSFLSDKDDFYRGGLNAEMDAMSEISFLFDVDEWVALKQKVINENQAFSQAGTRANLTYHTEMVRRAMVQLKQEQLICQGKGR